MIDILNLQPTTISRDLKGKYLCLYGAPKVGKTTFASQAPKNLLLAFEKGYNAISGIKVQDINKWADFKMVLKQLERPEAQEMYNTVTIDTIGICWEMCEDYICAQNMVKTIGDISWGRGYSLCKKEFESCLRKITMLGYGLIIIAHSEKRIEKDDDDSEIEYISPAIPKRANEIVNRLVDIIGYIDSVFDEDGNSKRYLYTRNTPTVMAGSRFKYLSPKIPFGYKELAEAIGDAIEKSEKLDQAVVVNKSPLEKEKERTFEEVQDEGRVLWTKLVEDDPKNAQKVMKIVENIFGRQMKLSEIQEEQKDLFELVISEMKAI